MQRKDLEGLSRADLVQRAESLGVARPRTLTVPELIDEILVAAQGRPNATKARGWFGRARDLLTSVIDRGLSLPGAQPKRTASRVVPAAPPPLPTVTLAEIYAAQGHLERAISTLDEVLAREPGHAEAASLRDRYRRDLSRARPSSAPPPSAGAPASASEAPASGAALDASRRSDIAAPAEPAATLEPAPSPSEPPAFDADEVVAVAVDPTTVYLYWEVRPRTLAASRAKDPDGAVVVRVVAVKPADHGPETETRDIRVDALFGELFVRGLPPAAQIRVSVGYKSAAAFEPFAVGIDLSTPRALPARDAARTVRRVSEVRAQAEETAFGQHGERAGLDAAGAPMPRSEPPARYPSGVWIDPAHRMVQVSPGGPGQPTRSVSLERLPGSSEIFRREAVWSPAPFAGPSSAALLPSTAARP